MKKEEKPRTQKKIKHGKLGEIVNKKGNFSREEEIEIQDATDPFYFEKYCGACMFFETEDCPYKGVLANTMWAEEIDCKKFFD